MLAELLKIFLFFNRFFPLLGYLNICKYQDKNFLSFFLNSNYVLLILFACWNSLLHQAIFIYYVFLLSVLQVTNNDNAILRVCGFLQCHFFLVLIVCFIGFVKLSQSDWTAECVFQKGSLLCVDLLKVQANTKSLSCWGKADRAFCFSYGEGCIKNHYSLIIKTIRNRIFVSLMNATKCARALTLSNEDHGNAVCINVF